MMPEIVALNQASWTALHESHATKGYNANVDYRIAYIVKRLVDSDIARRFMAIDFAHGTALKIYLVPACFYCHETNSLPCPPDLPHVFAHPSDAGFTIEYCNGPGVASSHLCGYGKEIPCLISLLRQMWDETGGELRSRDPGESMWQFITRVSVTEVERTLPTSPEDYTHRSPVPPVPTNDIGADFRELLEEIALNEERLRFETRGWHTIQEKRAKDSESLKAVFCMLVRIATIEVADLPDDPLIVIDASHSDADCLDLRLHHDKRQKPMQVNHCPILVRPLREAVWGIAGALGGVYEGNVRIPWKGWTGPTPTA